MIKFIISFVIFTLISNNSLANISPLIRGQNLVNQKEFSWKWDQAKMGTVVIFLSSLCPCSQSHVEYIKDLAKEFPEFSFLGIHSNANESIEDSKSYFSHLSLTFPVIQDEKSYWANTLKALRTPHAFIIDKAGTTVYEGGVTGSSDPSRAKVFYLKTALKNYLAGSPIPQTKTRVLGCEIKRN